MNIPARLTLVMILLVTVGCDRATKDIAMVSLAGQPAQSFFADTVRLTYAENPGGFLDVGANLPPAVRTALFTMATGMILVALTIVALRSRLTFCQSAGLALFIGGGASNWIDRVAYGQVIDFMNVGIGWLRTGVFNVADVAIMAGIATLLLAELRRKRER